MTEGVHSEKWGHIGPRFGCRIEMFDCLSVRSLVSGAGILVLGALRGYTRGGLVAG